MPLIVEFELENGEKVLHRIPAEIWKMSEPTVTKVFVTEQPAIRISLDPMLETADVDMSDNTWPALPEPTRFEIFQQEERSRWGATRNENPMQRSIRSSELEDSEE